MKNKICNRCSEKYGAGIFEGLIMFILFFIIFVVVFVIDSSQQASFKKMEEGVNKEISGPQEIIAKEESCEGESCNISKQLFDITFNLENMVIKNAGELSTIVTFENFGTVPTPVNLTFIILDANGNEIHRVEDSITVEVEEFMRKSFKGLNLSDGKYTLVLQTLYNVDVKDEFKKNFKVLGEVSFFRKHTYFAIFIVVGILVVLIDFVIRFIKEKKSGEGILSLSTASASPVSKWNH